MSNIQFSEIAWADYIYWQQQDRKTLRKINSLLTDISRNGALKGEGKPEVLKGQLLGKLSRRINEKDRLVYTILPDDVIKIHSCRGHYTDK